MWMQHVVTVEPAEEPVAIEEARAQVELTEGDDSFDPLLTIYIGAARGHFEDVTNQKLVTQTVVLRCSCWDDLERLPVAPVSEVVSVEYLDTAGVLQTLATSVYEAVLVALEPQIRLKVGQSWPQVRQVADAIRVTVTAGYGDAADVPAKLKQPLLLMAGHWFAHREDSAAVKLNEIPHGFGPLLDNHRI